MSLMSNDSTVQGDSLRPDQWKLFSTPETGMRGEYAEDATSLS